MPLLTGVYYREHAVEARLDDTLSCSVLSRDFASRHNVPMHVSVTRNIATCVVTGPIQLPIPSGFVSANFPIEVGHTKGADIILGRDWLNGHGLEGIHGRYCDLFMVQVSSFRPGFRWDRFAHCGLSSFSTTPTYIF